MWPSTSWSLSSRTRNIVLGSASVTSPSSSILSSFDTTRPSSAKCGARPRREPRQRGPSQLLDVHGLRALVALLLLVGDLGVLLQGSEALSVDARVMDKEVAAALVRGDEAVALLVVEPLDGSGWHSVLHLPVVHGFPPRSTERSARAVFQPEGPATCSAVR